MLYSPLDIHKMSGVVFVEAEGGEKSFGLPPGWAEAAEVTAAAGSQPLDGSVPPALRRAAVRAEPG
jgi:hypothetical protein